MQERVDTAGAVAAWATAKAAGAEAKPQDFVPDWSGEGGDRSQSPDDMIAVMRGLQSRRKGKT